MKTIKAASAALARIASGWPPSSAWWVLRYELAETTCPLCRGPHTLSRCKRWRSAC